LSIASKFPGLHQSNKMSDDKTQRTKARGRWWYRRWRRCRQPEQAWASEEDSMHWYFVRTCAICKLIQYIYTYPLIHRLLSIAPLLDCNIYSFFECFMIPIQQSSIILIHIFILHWEINYRKIIGIYRNFDGKLLHNYCVLQPFRNFWS